ncbi:Assimilatory nitrate reductase catalytic subunit [Zhongshania aliphaticivorans]|uniref:Assimilatory nitrate reductase catalytic subunit n=1 Tax=Zhongshania aliphaticivorans TaxID=1470434 RepID=A0A5S9PGI5_9GAMM|nr:molybdopterin-dependent oxidoreductase [Zhongshania aliphaticivorans]CAA0102785.1 Assimilatory nitrate reductase catalytic subunit [Zhongshania aliphaticivorans]CAA0113905.1 Assimilatory nitrate reductase catalytic subunit [Zhongshania aliphaticivorans]
MNTSYTVCGICEQACGLKVSTEQNQVIKIEPDKDNAFSWRDYCIKGAKSHLALTHPKRITSPMKRIGDRYVETSYEEAIADISARFGAITAEYGANALGSYTGNPNGFNFGSALFQTMLLDAIGTENRFWVGSIDQNALHVVSENLYGNPWVGLQTDIDYCDYFLLIGTNPQVSGMCWISYSPDGWKRVLARQKAGAEVVVVDPRTTECAAKANQHITPLPESDWALLLAMIKIIFDNGWDKTSKPEKLDGLGAIKALAQKADLNDLSLRCDISLDTINRIAEQFAKAPRAMAVGRTGVSLGRNGVLGLWLVQVLNLITNRVETEGGIYYCSGVLDFLDAGDTLFPKSEAISRLRGTKNIAGSHSLAELPDEITTPGIGQIRALIMNSGNPVVSGPDGDKLDAALAQLDCLVVIDQFQRESHRHADWLIPGDHFLERNDINPLLQSLSPAPRAQFTRAAVNLPDGMRYEWEFLRDLAMAMNAPFIMGKKWLNPIVKASIKLAKLTGNKHHGFSPLWLSRPLIKSGGMFKWKDIKNAEHGLGELSTRPNFGTLFNKLTTANGKVNLAPTAFINTLAERLTQSPPDTSEYPLQLIGLRKMKMMNSWSVETSMEGMKERELTGGSIEINRLDGERFSVNDGQEVTVSSATNHLVAKVTLSDSVRPGVAVMQHGWGYRTFNPKTGKGTYNGGVNRNILVSNKDVDPLSRVPRLNGTQVKIEATSIA